MATITEIAPDVFRLSLFNQEAGLQFNHFLIRDEEPLLFHAGYRFAFPELRAAVAQVLAPARLRWIGWSHFESDECGALNQWLEVAPAAVPVCSFLGVALNARDFAQRSARGLTDGEVLRTGKYRFRFQATPHLPHGWDAGMLFEETQHTLLCSDLFTHFGQVEPLLTEGDIVGRARETLQSMQASPFAWSTPYTAQTGRLCQHLAELAPKTLATMHGSSYAGNCAQALRELDLAMRELLNQ